MRSFLGPCFARPRPLRKHRPKPACRVEVLEARTLMAADPLPVLMVLADRQDFYYKEYGDTRDSIEAQGLAVEVAATTTNPSVAHPNSGQGDGDGVAVPDLTVADVDPANYSAIVFVGGWGASMYQYAYPGDYQNDLYDGDPATKSIVNDLINEFVDSDKLVAAICHGTTVLAWARVDGVSPLAGKQVSVPYIGSPAVFYNGAWYGNYALGQYEQAVANGAIANTVSGQYGDPSTVADDVVYDHGIMTAENYDAAAYFGTRIAEVVLAKAGGGVTPPANQTPEPPPASASVIGNDLMVRATPRDDTIYIWSGAAAENVFVWANGEVLASRVMTGGGRVIILGGDGNDQIFATDARYPVEIHGEGGHDLITGGSANDVIVGGAGVDRITANDGDDLLLGGDGDDYLYGGDGNDVLVGGAGNDSLQDSTGRNVLIGGLGQDTLRGGDDEDLLIGAATIQDEDIPALLEIRSVWAGAESVAERGRSLLGPPGKLSLLPDSDHDTLIGSGAVDFVLADLTDCFELDVEDLLRLI